MQPRVSRRIATTVVFAAATIASSAQAAGNFLSIPPLYATRDELTALTADSTIGARFAENSEIDVGDGRVVVLYWYEGSGVIHDFANVYRCQRGGSCSLLAMIHEAEDSSVSSQLTHRYLERDGKIVFSAGPRIVAELSVAPAKTAKPKAAPR